jgi:hypothetical protein
LSTGWLVGMRSDRVSYREWPDFSVELVQPVAITGPEDEWLRGRYCVKALTLCAGQKFAAITELPGFDPDEDDLEEAILVEPYRAPSADARLRRGLQDAIFDHAIFGDA